MASGHFTINFFSNYTGDHIITYTIYGCNTCSPTGPQPPITFACTANQNCSLSIPVTYDDPSCDEVKISGYIRPDCAPEPGVPFSGAFPIDGGCRNYTVKCNSSSGQCQSFNTLQICPTCEEWDSCSAPPGGTGYQSDTWTTYSWTALSPQTGFMNATNKIPTDAEFNLCYFGQPSLQQQLGPDWTVTLNTAAPTNDKPCCWECETLTFTFNPILIASYLVFPKIYPTIYYTACDAVCEDVPGVKCFATRHWIFTDPNVNSVTLCLRKDSWTVLGAVVGTTCIVGAPPAAGTCGVPQQYLP